MTYLVTIISLTPDTRLTEKREAFSMTLMVCVICVETLSRMRFWSRPAGDSRVDDDVVACDGWLDDAIAAVGTLQPRGRRGRRLRRNGFDEEACQQGARLGQLPDRGNGRMLALNRTTGRASLAPPQGARGGRGLAGTGRADRSPAKFTGLVWILGLTLQNNCSQVFGMLSPGRPLERLDL